MPKDTSYTSVIADGGNDQDVEQFEKEFDEQLEGTTNTSPSTTERTCAFMILFSLTFMFGVIVGQLLPAPIPGSLKPIDNNATDVTSIDKQDFAVSYSFISTTRGAQVLADLKETLGSGGPKEFLQELAKLMEEDDQIAASCHPLAHQVGRLAFKDLGFDGAFDGMIGTADDNLFRTCNAAYMHGIIEHYLSGADDLSAGVQYVETNICRKIRIASDPAVVSNKWECQHGIGHGVIQHFRAKYEKATLDDALDMCRSSRVSTSNCENGVWMDYFASTRLTAQVKPEMLDLCTEKRSTVCALYAPTEYLLHHPRDYAGALQFCHDGLEGSIDCINGVGGQVAKENMHDFSVSETACLTAKTLKYQNTCFDHALHYYQTASGNSKIPATLCENLTVFKAKCVAET